MDAIENTLLAVLNALPSPWLGDVSVGAPLAVGTGSVVLALALQHVVLAGPSQVWSLTQFYSVDFSKLRIGVKKCVFCKRTIKVCVSCC